ncbi:hypothetical protein BJP36_35835 [Moorena producens JHB]|uniref:Uncharacterized protein n=1 Tax=Moorena producens (strain JHB) TaxID=1454205 RepID=A0A9Q9STN4_MOOP1|nr:MULTISPECIES: hypothetical protein [Moorena]WAN69464.1 hypothetical protein BJP36_35835 [Moorena producens JHB]
MITTAGFRKPRDIKLTNPNPNQPEFAHAIVVPRKLSHRIANQPK